MPSGAKKRKAAKKKQQIQSNNGDEGVKNQHHTEDDAGEASSEGLRIGSGEKHLTVEKNVEREFKIEDDGSDRKDGSTEHDDSTRNSYDGGSSRGSSRSNSSSDDEGHDIIIKNGQSAGDISSLIDSVKVDDSVSKESSKSIHVAPIEEEGDLVVRKITTVDSVKILSLSEQSEVGVSSPADISKENGAKKQSGDEIEVGKSLALDPKECGTQEIDDRVALPYHEPRPSSDNRAEPEKDYGVNEPLLAPSPPGVQKTSWKSCCGLFEMFSGSGS